MSNDLVVQLGAKLDQFASDMNQAGDMADSAVSRIEQSFASLNPTAGGLGGLATVFTGAVGSVVGLLAALQKVNSELAEMAKNAEFVGVSVERFQQIQFAAGQSGISNSQSTNDLSNTAKLLADAKYNENSLTRLLDENNIKYKDRNGQVISLNQLLTIAGGLLAKFDSIPDKTKAAQMLGLSQGWVGALHDGAAAFNKVADGANAAGAVIDSQTVAKAAAFDAAWKKSSDLLSRQFKAAAGDVAVVLDGLIDKANEFFASLAQSQGKNVGDSGQAKFNAYADALEVASKQAGGLTQDVDQLTRVIERMAQTGGDPDIIKGLQEARKEAQATLDQQNRLNDAFDKTTSIKGPIPTPVARPAAANIPTGTGKIPQRGGAGADPVQDAINSLQKHTLATQADADAVGQGAAALAGFRADAVETAAVLKNGGKEADAQVDAFSDLKDSAIAAADALAKAKVASDISRGQQTALFTPEDLAIANQLKGIYGDDIPAAMRSSEAASLRFNDTIKTLGTLGQQVNSGFLVDFETQIRNGASAMAALQTAGLNALGKIADKLASMAADNLWSAAFGGSGGAGSFFSSIFGGGSGAVNANGSIAGALGPTSVGGAPLVGAFASGTDFAPGGVSLVGEHGPELLNIPKGAQVIPNDVLRNGGGGGGSNFVYSPTIDARGADAAAMARLTAVVAKDRSDFERNVKAVVAKTRINSPGAFG